MRKNAWCVLIMMALLSGCFTKKEVDSIRSFYTTQADGLRAEIATLKQELRDSRGETELMKRKFMALKSVLEASYGQTTKRTDGLRALARCTTDMATNNWTCQLRATLVPKSDCQLINVPSLDRPYNTEARAKEDAALAATGLSGMSYQVVAPVGMERGCKYSFEYTVVIIVE